MEKLKHILHALWQFLSYLFWPQWGKKRQEEQTDSSKMADQSTND